MSKREKDARFRDKIFLFFHFIDDINLTFISHTFFINHTERKTTPYLAHKFTLTYELFPSY